MGVIETWRGALKSFRELRVLKVLRDLKLLRA